MGAHSTLYITRKKAMDIILSKLMGGITDEELERYTDNVLYDRLYNVIIVPDSYENNDNDVI